MEEYEQRPGSGGPEADRVTVQRDLLVGAQGSL
jgi:hypothetical protein